MKVLVVNSGSSSLKYQLIDTATEAVLAKGVCERIGAAGSVLKGKGNDKEFSVEQAMPDHVVAVKLVLNALTDPDHGVIASPKEIDAVGHRVVQSGGLFDGPVILTDEVIETMKQTFDLAPLHNVAAIKGAVACRKAMPGTPMTLVFDTTFHATMPPKAYMYAIPYEDYEKYRIRKYGFHGTSHMYVSRQAAKFLGKDPAALKIVTCHLGNGASCAAVDGGKCVDTSMGFTPLEGLVMGTRTGDMDLAAFEYLCEKRGMDMKEGIQFVNKQCGVLGVSGISSDFRDLEAAAAEGNERAILAIEMFGYRVRKYIGAYAAAMGGVDCIVFTAGIGEHTPAVRRIAVEGLEFLGVKLDPAKNEHPDKDIAVLNTPDSRVFVLLIPTNEELVIAQETVRLVQG